HGSQPPPPRVRGRPGQAGHGGRAHGGLHRELPAELGDGRGGLPENRLPHRRHLPHLERPREVMWTGQISETTTVGTTVGTLRLRLAIARTVGWRGPGR